MIELELKSPWLSEEALENFSAELQARKSLRQSKERHEKRFHRKLMKKEKRQGSTVIVPSGQNEDSARRQREAENDVAEDLRQGPPLPSQEPRPMERSQETAVVEEKKGVEEEEEPAVASFAKMLRCGKTQAAQPVAVWPDLAPKRESEKGLAGEETRRPWGSKMGAGKEERKEDAALWSGTDKNRDVSTGPLARPFARSLAPLTRLLAPDCSLRSRPPLCSLVHSLAHFAHSLARGKGNH